MATFMTELDEAGEVLFLMEAETTGAFAKSELEIKPNPLQCYKQAVSAIGLMAERMAAQVGKAVEGTGVDAEVSFALKIDAVGMVMISANQNCQLNVTLRFKG